MPGINYAFREDWTGSGFFGFRSTGVQYADKSIVGLRHSIYFDQGPWVKVDSLGTSTYAQTYDSSTGRTPDALTIQAVDGGTGTAKATLYRRMRLPRDFGKWSVVSFFVLKSGVTSAISSLKFTLFRNNVPDEILNGVSILPIMAVDWEQVNETPFNTYAPGDFITFAVELITVGTNVTVELADFGATYVTDKGNV